MNLPKWIQRISPLAASLPRYSRKMLAGDLVAGLVVAVMLVPQAMAYAMLAGLPPEVGLYASIAPLVLYSLLGTSNALAIGPVAMVSLLVFAGVGELASPGSPEFISYCLTLALLIGVLQIAMAVFRLGFLVNFISHPVLIGFTSAAAVVIGFSQLKHLLGISVERSHYPFELMANTITKIGSTNTTTLTIGLASCLLLALFAYGLKPLLMKLGLREESATTLSKLGPLLAVMIASWVVFKGQLQQTRSVSIVGNIPSGLPGFTLPDLNWSTIRSLLPLALVITVVGYLESISVAMALASRKREKINANRELLALGIADVGAAFTGGYPVTGGFSRSMVNYSAGVRSPLGAILTAIFVAISVMFLTPWFVSIPKAVLGAIIIVAVAPLIDFKTPVKLWRYSRPDAIACVVTFFAVMVMGIENGILIGVATTIVTLMGKISRPHIVEVGQVGLNGSFRNSSRYDVDLTSGVLALRIDESLNFANAQYLETYVIESISNRPDVKQVLLISSGINDIDATGLEVLETIHQELAEVGVEFYLSDVKGLVLDRFQLAGYGEEFLNEHIFPTAAEAIRRLRTRNGEPAQPASPSAKKQRPCETAHKF